MVIFFFFALERKPNACSYYIPNIIGNVYWIFFCAGNSMFTIKYNIFVLAKKYISAPLPSFTPLKLEDFFCLFLLAKDSCESPISLRNNIGKREKNQFNRPMSVFFIFRKKKGKSGQKPLILLSCLGFGWEECVYYVRVFWVRAICFITIVMIIVVFAFFWLFFSVLVVRKEKFNLINVG